MKKCITFLLLLCVTYITKAQISGTVYRDYNNSGTRETTNPAEPLANGVIVNVYNSAEALVGTATTAGTTIPNYSIAVAAGTYRVEFILPNGMVNTGSSARGAGSGTAVQFVTAPSATVNFGIFNKNEFFQNNPRVAISSFKRGTVAPLSTTDVVLETFAYTLAEEKDGSTTTTWTGNVPPNAAYRIAPTAELSQSQVGSVYGLTWSQNDRKLYMSSYLRRKAPLGSGGLGAIYVLNNPAGSIAGNTPSLYVNLNTLFSNGPGGTLAFTRETNNAYNWNDDNQTKGLVGTKGLGDIELNNNGDTLYTIGLNDRKLYAVPTSGTLSAATIKSVDFISSITALTGVAAGSFANAEIHPFAIGVNPRDNFIYIGGVYGDDGAGVSTNIRMLVWRYNPADGSTTLVLNQFLGYNRSCTPNAPYNTYGAAPGAIATVGTPGGGCVAYRSWTNTFTEANAAGGGASQLEQPMLTDIVFDGDVMILGFRDRYGDQTPIAGINPGDDPYSRGHGEIVRVHNAAGTWTLESAGVSRDGNTGANITGSTVANTGPGSGEFYYQDWASDGDVFEGAMGALLIIPGKNQIMTTAFDPVKVNSNNNLIFANPNTNGVQIMNNTNGQNVGAYEVYTTYDGSVQPYMAKTNGMGDIEALFDQSTIEIGNRIWNDVNGDGIQNAGEAALANVTVELFLDANNDGVPDGAAIGTVTTDANGNYIFTSASGTDVLGTDFGVAIAPNQNYILRIAASDWTAATGTGTGDLAGYQLTKTDKLSNGQVDFSDNDASLSTGANQIPQIRITTGQYGQNNHNLDFGFRQLASIGNRVWLDNGVGTGGTANDGIQNGTEPGVAGITVTLYQNGADGLPGTTDDIVLGTAVTDAYGNYLFENLPASTNAATSYNVGFTLPTNYQFTTQTNTQVTGTSDATNTTTVSGGSTAANGSDANPITGRTGSFWLTTGERETGADAGIKFTPVVPNSIGDKVWFDNGLGGGTPGNGIQDGTEPGVAGVTVQLLDDITGAVVATTVTDANGNYVFTNLPANTNYKIKVIPPVGMVFAAQDVVGSGSPGSVTDGTTDSDVNPVLSSGSYGVTSTINTGAIGTQITNVDAGLVTQAAGTASLGDRVWNDLNGNGIQDAGEPGIANASVSLYEDANGDGVLTGAELTPVRTTRTDAFGNYNFSNLVVTANNRWQVQFVQPSGFTYTTQTNTQNGTGGNGTPTGGATVANGSDANTSTGRSGFIRLKNDERNSTIDAGFVSTAPGILKLGDKVWRDDNSNGIQEANESGVAGVTVKLYQNGADGLPGTADDVLVGTTTTDINGNYLFTNLSASTGASSYYNVQYSNIPPGFSFTTQTNTQSSAGASNTPTGGATNANGNDANSAGKTGSYNLTADNLDVDAGIKQGVASGKGSIGNKVWVDLTGGTANVQDANEPGVAGVRVELYRDANGDGVLSGAELTPVATTTTNALGEYIFDNLDAGVYQVGFSGLPAGYGLAGIDAGADDTVDSDGNPLNTAVSGNTATAGKSYTNLITLAQGEDNTTIDLGLTPPAGRNTLGNQVWWDQNSNGTQDGTEPGVPGVMVTLVNASGQFVDVNGIVVTTPVTTTTDVNGRYLFTGLADGPFAVRFSNLPAGFDFTTKETNVPATDVAGSDADRVTGTTGIVTLNFAAGGTQRDNRSLDAGLVSTRAALGNRVWDDLNGDGIQNSGEPGVAGVTVTLFAADGVTVISSTITDQNGNYLFANLNPGTYVVGFSTLPSGKQFTTQDNTTGPDGDGANTVTGGGDSDVDRITGKTAPITLTAGQVNLTVDAGIRSAPLATVGNRVWDDLNGDGIQNTGEPGIPGVVATLYNNLNQPIGSAVTDGNGNWLITNVPPGTGYYVIFTNKPIGNWTVQDNGGAGTGGASDSDTDSDVNPSGQTGAFDVAANTINVKIDAGILQSVILSVHYTSFTALKQGNTSLLNFVVAQAATGSTFVIERSTSGTLFSAIGTVQGNSTTSYTYTDITPVLTGKNYYRIKQVDANGQVSYSDIRIVKFSSDAKVDVYPVPANQFVSITFDASTMAKPANVIIYNAQGKVVINQVISTTSTSSINVSMLAAGTYQLRIVSNNTVITTQQIVIVK